LTINDLFITISGSKFGINLKKDLDFLGCTHNEDKIGDRRENSAAGDDDEEEIAKIKVKKIMLTYDKSDSEERLLRHRSNDAIIFWDVSPSNLISFQEIKFKLEPRGETVLFSALKEAPQQIGFFYGESNDGKQAINLLSTKEDAIFGSIVDITKNQIYQFQPKHDGKIHMIHKDVAEFIDEGEPITKERGTGIYHAGGIESTSNDDGSVIDIMIVWTKSAECTNSALPEDCVLTDVTRNNMIGKTQLAVAETNTAFALSGINTKLRLVHAYLHPTYAETDLLTALNHITASGDIHEKRTKYGADVVSFWVNHHKCGLGWLGPSKQYMFAVVSHFCATGYFSFAHEFAHNMGCHHDRGTENKCDKAGLGYGYREKSSKFRDIMAYNCKSGQCDDNAGRSCSRIQRFSNIYFEYEDHPVGNERNNCAHHINSNLSTVASFFSAKTDEELADLKASEPEQAKIEVPPPDSRYRGCKERNSNCNNNNLCCSGKCSWRRCL